MHVTLIIPTRNRPELLRRSVEAAATGEVAPAEIIVIDQSDAEWLSPQVASVASAVRYVHDPGRGVSRARNIGLELAKAPIVALIDDDIVVDRGWLGALVHGLRPGVPAIRSGNIRAEGRPGTSWAPSVSSLTRDRVVRRPIDEDVLYSSSMAMTLDVVDAIGFFDERFGPGSRWPSAEDNDFAYRALRSGVPIELVAGATAVHLEWREAAQLTDLSRSYGRGQGAFYAKHFRQDRKYVARRASQQVVTWSARVARGVIRDRQAARRELAYLVGLATGAVTWTILRDRSSAGPSRPSGSPTAPPGPSG